MAAPTTSSRPVDLFVYVLRSPSQPARERNVAHLSDMFTQLDKHHRVVVTPITSNEPQDLTAAGADALKSIVDLTTPIVAKRHAELYAALSKRPLHLRQLSNTLKHHTAIRMAAENAVQHPRAAHLVLEDDVLFSDQAAQQLLSRILPRAPPDAAFVFLGLPSTQSGAPEAPLFEPIASVFKVLPCCDSYLISAHAAEVLSKVFLPIRLATPAQLSFLILDKDLPAYVCSPCVFLDGTKVGAFLSSIEQNNELCWNPHWNQVRRLVQLGPAEASASEALLRDAAFKEHPDFRHMLALLYMRQRNYPMAKKEFDKALETYLAEGSILGADSRFLKDFIGLFRFLQNDVAPSAIINDAVNQA